MGVVTLPQGEIERYDVGPEEKIGTIFLGRECPGDRMEHR
jgi:hypothetical protein